MHVLYFQWRISHEHSRILNGIPNLAELRIAPTSLEESVFFWNIIPLFQPWIQPHQYFKYRPDIIGIFFPTATTKRNRISKQKEFSIQIVSPLSA